MAQSRSLTSQTKAKEKDTLAFINGFIDDNSFMETDMLVKSVTPLGEATGEGVVSGFGCIGGMQTAIFATDAAVMKGSIGEGAVEKITRIINSAVKTGAPLIAVIDTSGARFGEGARILGGYGKIFDAMAKAYDSVTTVCILKGNNFGMMSYFTAFCDFVVALDKSVMATSSPLILASKTKEDVAKVGSVAVHTAKTGLIHAVVKTTAELKKTVKEFISLTEERIADSADDLNRACKGLKVGAKPSAIIKEVFDKDTFLELRADYAPEVVTGLARLGGITVGIAANNASVNEGRLSSNSAVKISELVILCDNMGIPVINLVDCAGAVNDLSEENSRLIRDVGIMLYNYANTTKKISLVVGKAIGVGYTAFAANSMYDYSAAWTDAEIGVMDASATARLIYGKEIAKAKDKKKAKEKFADAYSEENMSAQNVATLGLLDNVIKPEHTRRFLVGIVQTFLSAR